MRLKNNLEMVYKKGLCGESSYSGLSAESVKISYIHWAWNFTNLTKLAKLNL